GDPEIEAQRRALRRGDEASAARLAVLRTALEREYTASDRLLLELTTLAERSAVANREQQREELIARSNAVSVPLRPQRGDRRAPGADAARRALRRCESRTAARRADRTIERRQRPAAPTARRARPPALRRA